MSRDSYRAFIRPFAFLFTAVFLVLGCSRPPDLKFTPADGFSELPDLHQQQIRETLVNFFGTPLEPHLITPVEVEEVEWDKKTIGQVRAIRMGDGTSHTGEITGVGEETITLKPLEGAEVTLQTDDIEASFMKGQAIVILMQDESAHTGTITDLGDGTLTLRPLRGLDTVTLKIEEIEETIMMLEERLDRDHLAHGAAVFRKRCAACHGITGDGAGEAAAYLNPKPRDFRRGIYKFTSTRYGKKPRRSDLVRTVLRGAKGTSMPSFRWLPKRDLSAVVDYVIMLSHRGEVERALIYIAAEDYAPAGDDDDDDSEDVEPLEKVDIADLHDDAERIARGWRDAQKSYVVPASIEPVYSEETIELGRQAFLKKECWKCHGKDGRGHTQENVGKDAWGNTVKAADLTTGMLHGGRRSIDVYRRIHNGINGTPMPEFGQAYAETPDTIWHLAHFILSVADGREFSADGAGTEASGGEP